MRRFLPLCLALSLLLALPAIADGAQRQKRVVGGTDVADGDYPWAVALFPEGETPFDAFCGGTLISPTVVVTAAHCVLEPPRLRPTDLKVYAGDKRVLSQADDDPADQADYFDVSGITLHPDIDVGRTRFDVALLTLASPVAAGRAIDIIQPSVFDTLTTGEPLQVAGWGRDVPVSGSVASDEMNEANVELRDDAQCETVWGAEFFEQDMFCALGPAGDFADTCNGDSGGPIMRGTGSKTDPNNWKLVGATSFGSPNCNETTTPGVYVRLGAQTLFDFTEAVKAGTPPQLTWLRDGRPALNTTTPKVGDTVTCAVGTVDFEPDSSVVTLELARSDGQLIATGPGPLSHVAATADVGRTLGCRAFGINPGSGPFGDVSPRSTTAPVAAAPAPAPTPEPVPAPPVVTSPPPPVIIPVDAAAPRVSGFSRQCTRRRRCTLRVRVSDAAPSFGVAVPQVRVTSTVKRRCVRNGRRRTCTKRATKTLRARRSATATTFLVTTGVLPRGRHAVSVTVSDVAGNRRRLPFTTSFTLR